MIEQTMAAPECAEPKVLIFDSGVGGLSITTCIQQAVPSARLGYVADNACFPYGNQSETVVVRRCLTLLTAALQEFPADVVVVACNTASTVVLPALRAALPVPVVGVVPAVKPAVAMSSNRRIGILATPATIRRPYLDQLVVEFAGDCTVARVGHPALVQWIEDWVAGEPLPMDELRQALEPFVRAEVDTVVLGCTHYPLIRTTFEALVPTVVHWVDSGPAIARRTLYLLQTAGIVSASHNHSAPASGFFLEVAFFTGSAPLGIEQYMMSLGLRVARVVPEFCLAALSRQ